MGIMDSSDRSPLPKADFFSTTHWTVVLAAQREDSSRQAAALSRLCETYWYPLYAFVRRKGYGPHDSQDLTQSFFARLLEKGGLSSVEQEKGKFRSFLLASMKYFLANEWNRARARKRGGGQIPISIDAEVAEGKYRHEPADGMTAEHIYERRWAMTVLERGVGRLREEQDLSGTIELFEALKNVITGDPSTATYAETAVRLGMSEGAVKVAAHRLRRRYRDMIREEIAHCVSDPDEIEGEIQYLFRVLSGK